MKVKTLSALAGLAGAAILSGNANATFTGVSVSLYTSLSVEGQARDVYRLYANFSNPAATTQSVGAWGGSPTNGATTTQQILANGNPGSGFYNNAFGGSVAPGQALVTAFPDLAWDTFGTIGLAIQPGTGGAIVQAPSPGFPSAIFEGTGSSNNNFSFAAGGQPAFSQIDAQGRVLLAQFTVNAGQHVRGTVGSVAGFHETGLAGLTTFSQNGGTFNSVPAPGALALLGLAGLVGSRRRRA